MQYAATQLAVFRTQVLTALVAIVGVGAAACGPSEEIERQLAELQVVSAEKDSLIAQVTDNSLLLSQISIELANAMAPASGEEQEAANPGPAAILGNIRELSARLDESEVRLAESRGRVRELTRGISNRDEEISRFEKVVTDLQTAIDNQRRTIVSLTEQVETLRLENVQLVVNNEELTRTVDDMTARENTAWYIVGTKEELIEKGIVTEEGGSRVLFVFGKRGKTVVPAREIDLSLFNRMDVTDSDQIPLPDADARYRIVSLQDLRGIENLRDDEDRFTGGALYIGDPDRFWANSRVLVVVQQS